MKKLILSVAGVACFAPAFAINLLQNPGFESGQLSPWVNGRNFGGSGWSISTNNPHSGQFCATDVGNAEIRQDFAATLGSQITEVSFWLRHPDGGGLPAAYDLFYSDGTDFENVVFTNTANWEHFDVTNQVDKTKKLVALTVWGFSGGGSQTTFVDDAVVNAVPEPASLCVLGLGLLAFRRRSQR